MSFVNAVIDLFVVKWKAMHRTKRQFFNAEGDQEKFGARFSKKALMPSLAWSLPRAVATI